MKRRGDKAINSESGGANRRWRSGARAEFDFSMPTLFRPRTIHYSLAAFTLATFIGLGGFSIYSASPHEVEKLAILNESNDAASLAYSQRESFATLLAIEQWGAGLENARDVAISRALLGQRLSVQVQGNIATYSLMTSSYKSSLALIDQLIAKLNDGLQEDREKFLLPYRPALDTFGFAVRQMSHQIQVSSLGQVNRAVKNRAHSELLQSIFLVLSYVTLLWLIFLVMRDFGRGYQKQREAIKVERKRLDAAMENVKILQSLDEMQSFLFSRPVESWSPEEFQLWIETSVAEISPNPVKIEFSGGSQITATLEPIAKNDVTNLQSALIASRIQEIINMHEMRLRMYSEALYRSQHDALTGLKNENGLQNEISKLVTVEPVELLAGIFLDIDRFQRINDSLGYSRGDEVLQRVAEKIDRLCPDAEVTARLHSDEFIVLRRVENEAQARHLALQLQADLKTTVASSNLETELTFSVGLVILKTSALSHKDLLHDGDIAKTLAGRQQISGFGVYSEAESGDFRAALTEEYALRQAVKHGEFSIFLQPIISLIDGRIVGAEALARWLRPGYGVLYPAEFLTKLKKFNLQTEFNNWVLQTVVRMRASAYVFQAQYQLSDFQISFNLDPNQLLEADLSERLLVEFDRAGVKARDITLEVTEQALEEGTLPISHLQRMLNAGCSISLDDFGTGYSSLSRAQALPITSLKIDKSFLRNVNIDSADRSLVKDLKGLADTLEIYTIAEGVESLATSDFLRNIGINHAQGYLYSAALPEIDFWNWVRDYQARVEDSDQI